jgi:hypothetical protein
MSSVEEKVVENPAETKTEEVKEIPLSDVVVEDPNTALNVLVSFVNLANKRGVFNVQESAKIWECIQQFQKK